MSETAERTSEKIRGEIVSLVREDHDLIQIQTNF
jgi:hypothetical protein